MTDTITFWGEVLSVILSITASVFCFFVYWQYRLRKSAVGWLALALSLAIILVSGLLSFAAANDQNLGQWMDSYNWVILVSISMLQLYAFWKMMGSYDEESKTEYEAVGRLFKLKQKQIGKVAQGQKKR